MCGIYGYIGRNAVGKVLQGIKNLEYRGYDSAGVAFIDQGFNCEKIDKKYAKNIKKGVKNLYSIREKGEIDKLKTILDELSFKSKMAIGHTRWATHGQPEIKNCHPHFSPDGRWAIVHNGIIENYQELKQQCEEPFESETDSEVVAHLLQKNSSVNPLESLRNVCRQIKGSYALAIIFVEDPEKIYVARNNSPVAVGVGKKCGVVCSDVNGLDGASKVFLLDNQNLAVVERGRVEIFDFDLNALEKKEVEIEKIEDVHKGKSYPHFMSKEIDEIPYAIEKTTEKYKSHKEFSTILPECEFEGIKSFVVVGCGTAYHAGVVGANLFEKECKLPARAEIASEFLYKPMLYGRDTLAIFVSQSGETADTLKAMKRCHENGLKTLAITNVKNSTISRDADYCLYTSAGKEVAVASTKAFNCQVALFHLLVAYFKGLAAGENFVSKEYIALLGVARLIKENDIDALCREIAQEIKDEKNIYMIGRGGDFLLAQESSLKLKEVSYIHCEAYPAGELKHGTISLIDEGTFVFGFATGGETYQKTMANIKEVESRGGKAIVFSQFCENGDFYRLVKLPAIEEKHMILQAVVYMQKIAYYTSVMLGNNPDKPRSLAKSVTVE